jgi:hypothetical protein
MILQGRLNTKVMMTMNIRLQGDVHSVLARETRRHPTRLCASSYSTANPDSTQGYVPNACFFTRCSVSTKDQIVICIPLFCTHPDMHTLTPRVLHQIIVPPMPTRLAFPTSSNTQKFSKNSKRRQTPLVHDQTTVQYPKQATQI